MSLVEDVGARAPITLPDTSCIAFLDELGASAPQRVVFIEGDRRWTAGELVAAGGAAAGVLAGAGVGAGDRVVLSLPTSVEYFVWAYGVLSRGAVVVPVYENAPAAEFVGRARGSGAGIAVAGDNRAAARSDARAEGGAPLRLLDPDAWKTMAESPPPARAAAAPHDHAFLFYSSGSTGMPKAIPLTHRNILAGRMQFAQATLLGPRDVLVHFLPPVHVYGWMAVTAAIGAGATVVLHRRYDFARIVADTTRYRATAIFGVPRLIIDMAAIAHSDVAGIGSLRFMNTGSAPLAPEITREAMGRTGVLVTCGYGLTEAAPTSHSLVDRPELADPGAVGYPVALTSLRLVDPDDPLRPVAGNGPGELVVRGPQVASGYLLPDGTTDREDWLADGGFRTGDLVKFGPDGRLRIVGRLKSIIKYNGYSIAPAELEAVLAQHRDVLDCAVLGRADPVAGEIPTAFVVPRGPGHVSADEMVAFVRERVSAQRSVRELVFVNAIPRSEAGKVIAAQLLDQA